MFHHWFWPSQLGSLCFQTSLETRGRCKAMVLTIAFPFLQRSKEVLHSEAIPNTKIQAINRGLKKRKKHGKLIPCVCLAFFSHGFHLQDLRMQNGILSRFQRSCQNSKQVIRRGIKVGGYWWGNWRRVSASMSFFTLLLLGCFSSGATIRQKNNDDRRSISLSICWPMPFCCVFIIS